MPTYTDESSVSFDGPHLHGRDKDDDDSKGKVLDHENEQKPKKFHL